MNDVKVKIDLTKPVGRMGLGTPLILHCKSTEAESGGTITEDIAYTECSSLDEVKTAGYEETTDTYRAIKLLFMQNEAPKKIAVCTTTKTAVEWLSDLANLNKDWRQLICVYSDNTAAEANVAKIIPKIEATSDKMFFAGLPVDSTFKASDVSDITEIKRTVLFYCTDGNTTPYKNPEAALVGATAGLEAGSFTYKNVILCGITPQVLTDVEIEAIHQKGGITFVTKAGDNVTTEGKVAGGEYIDIIDTEDYIIQQLTYRTQKLLNTSKKIAYTNNGIAMLESVAIDVLQKAFNNGVIATKADGSPDYSVNYMLREDTKETDRVERRYVGGQFTFALAGAIHYVEITGEITV